MVFGNSQGNSLVEKFNLSLEQLDYKYIENCKNVKQLEKILIVLNSGEEGTYPHLIQFCEKKLKDMDSNNKLLHPAEGITCYSDLSEKERNDIQTDLLVWSNEQTKRFSSTEINRLDVLNNLPPIRSQTSCKEFREHNIKMKPTEKDEMQSKSCKPRSYEEWNKYSVEDELEKIEKVEKIEPLEESQMRELNIYSRLALDNSIIVEGLSEVERENLANSERMKGNEAFKGKDYEEALIYYTRSLSACRTARTLSNRAQANIKLKKYFAAVIDCNEVIEMEPNNMKALYRRGIAHKEAEIYELAAIDFEILLELDPSNKSAKEQLQQIEILKAQNAPAQKVIIEELESEFTEDRTRIVERVSTIENEIGTRLIIEEITDAADDVRRPMLDEICECAEEESSIQPLSKKTKEMLSIFNHSKTVASDSASKIGVAVHPEKGNKNSKIMKNGNATENSKEKNNIIMCYPVLEVPLTMDAKNETEFLAIPIQNQVQKVHGDPCVQTENTFQRVSKTDIDAPQSKNRKHKGTNEEKTSEKINGLKEESKEERIKEESKEERNGETNMESDARTMPRKKVTPFEFVHAWSSCNANVNHSLGTDLLLSVEPGQLKTILTNKLDGPFLHGILMAIENVVKRGYVNKGFNYLKNLMNVPRIGTIALFLSNEEKKGIEEWFDKMEKKNIQDFNEICEVLGIQKKN